MVHSEEYAATAHLVSLAGGLPIPSDEPRDFWFKLWQASGNPIFLPGNIRHQVLRSLQGDGKALADQLITALSEMSGPQRKAASAVIGEALEGTGMWGSSPGWLGDLWLQDVERTAWRILYARRENAENSLELSSSSATAGRTPEPPADPRSADLGHHVAGVRTTAVEARLSRLASWSEAVLAMSSYGAGGGASAPAARPREAGAHFPLWPARRLGHSQRLLGRSVDSAGAPRDGAAPEEGPEVLAQTPGNK